MRIVAHSKYNVGDHVDFTHSHPKSVNDTGVIREVSFTKKQVFRDEVVWITYLIEPDSMIGSEHDNYYDVHENDAEILGRIPA